MKFICFDLGGTIINDPFDDILMEIKKNGFMTKLDIQFNSEHIKKFFRFWTIENRNLHFEHASHFLQEEIWAMRAGIKLTYEYDLGLEGNLPIIIPLLINEYRTILKKKLNTNQFVEKVKSTLIKFKNEQVALIVASNDREFATKAMLQWSNLLPYFDKVFTSEYLSINYQNAEKPSKEFFIALKNELIEIYGEIDQLVYIGDSESNDILPAQKSGFTTVRFINKKNLKKNKWIDQNEQTEADYFYNDTDELETIIYNITQSWNA